MGSSKTDATLSLMTNLLKDAHVVALQEVVAGKGLGARRVADLESELDRSGAEWDSVTSNPTNSSRGSSERYAYLIRKPFGMNRDTAVLATELDEEIEREPYTLRLNTSYGKTITLVSLHAVPTQRKPEREIEALTQDNLLQSPGNTIVAGDLNLPSRTTDKYLHQVNFVGHIRGRTSLGRKLDAHGTYTRHQYDNVYTKGDIVVCASGTIDFVPRFGTPVSEASLRRARNEVSDHLPVFIQFGFK
jgi:endonuclease/exonuclease/phosphatase family metal-dependent hydrolase